MTRFSSPRASVWLTVAALTVMCGVAVAPLLTGTMPETADGTIHLYRLPILDHAFKDGSLFPRYPVATVYGFGSPLFNFYSPTSLYPMHFLHLAGLSYLNAWLVGMALYVIVAAGGAYLLGRTWGGGAVGVVAAAAYVYAPYFVYDVLWRGTTSETAALAILPYVLWAIKTQADHPSRRTFLAVILSLALFVQMHNVSTVLGGALIGLYALFVVATARDRVRAFMRVFGALALGALLATFYWYPAIRETPNIKIDAVTAALPDIDVTRNLVSASSAFQPPYPADPSLQQPPFAVAFGWPQLMFGALGIVTIGTQVRRIRWLILLAVAGIAFLLFMLTPASAPVWRTLPLIGYSQYPTRLLGPASLLLAVAAGFGVNFLVARALRLNGKMVRLGIPVGLIILFALPLGVRTPQPEHDPRSVVDALDFERESGFVGSSSFGEYVPVWTETLPDTDSLRDAYARETFIPRLRPPEGVTVVTDSWKLTSGSLTVIADAPATLTFDWLYLPYFQAKLGDQPLEVVPSEREGRVQVQVPAGTHRLEIWLAPSRTQAIATVVSFTALLATLGIMGLWPLLRGKPAVAYFERFEYVRETRRALLAAILVGLAGLGAKAVFDRVPSPLRHERFADGYGAGVTTVTDTNFGRSLTLIGFDPPAVPVQAGLDSKFMLYWTPRVANVVRDYVAVFTVRTLDGREVTRMHDDRPGGLETHHWRQGQYVMQPAGIPIPPGTPPGTYSLSVSLYDIETGVSLDIINVEDNPVGVDFPLGTFEVTRGEPLDHPGMRDVVVGPDGVPLVGQHDFVEFQGIRVIGLEGLPDEAAAGAELEFSGLWGMRSHEAGAAFSLEWQTAENLPIASSPLDLNDPYPMAAWEVGDLWRLQHRATVPAEASGDTLLFIRSTDGSIVFAGQIDVIAPERTYEPPTGIISLDAEWDNGVRLIGFSVGDASVTLYWTTDRIVSQFVHRFAHVLSDDGTIVQVVDGVPADWQRPVTGWLPGEYVADVVPLAVTSGQVIRVGFYDPHSGSRVSAGAGTAFDFEAP